MDGALFAAWLAWVAVQQQIQVSERDSDLRQIDTLTERSIVLRSEIAELNATRKWAQSTFRSLNKTPYGPGGVIVISPAETRREVIFLDDIGTFALRTNLAQVGPAFNACLTSFHQLADSFRKPNLSDDEMKRLYTASRGNVARLDDWSREIQRLIEQKEQQAKELTEHIALLKKTVGKR